jgi:DNA-binding NtrC family response regulator
VPNVSKNLVYVVDDELLIAQIVEAILRRERFDVRTFSDPAQALAAFEAAPTKPALLITDYVMSPFTGLDLIGQCRAIDPSLRAIVISGNVGGEILETGTPGRDAFLAKPFLPKHLIGEVQSIMSGLVAA